MSAEPDHLLSVSALKPVYVAWEAAYKGWKNKPKGAQSVKVLEHTFRDVLRAAYAASQQAEEGRSLRFRLLITQCDPVHLRGVEFLRVGGHKLSALEKGLVKLAPALNDWESFIVVGPVGETKVPGITGVAHRRDAFGGVLDRHRYQPVLPDPVAHLSVLGPGKIEVLAGSAVVGRIRGCKWTLSPAAPLPQFVEAAPVEEFFASFRDDIAQKCARHDQTFRSRVERDILAVVRRVITDVDRRRHGGTLVFSGSTEKPRIKEKHTIADSRIQKYLAESLKVIARERDETKVHTSEDFLNARYNLSRLVNFVGSLSQVDGAVVLDNKLCVHGFGAKVILDDDAEAQHELWERPPGAPDKKMAWGDLTGMRHKSGANAAAQVGSGQGFTVVISNDGGAKCFYAESNGSAGTRLIQDSRYQSGDRDYWLAKASEGSNVFQRADSWYSSRKGEGEKPD